MAFKSAKQHNFMSKGKSNKGVGPSMEVSEEFAKKGLAKKRSMFTKKKKS